MVAVRMHRARSVAQGQDMPDRTACRSSPVQALLTDLCADGAMTRLMIIFPPLLLIIAACDGGSPHFMGIEPTRV
jgi:hypothetical protein